LRDLPAEWIRQHERLERNSLLNGTGNFCEGTGNLNARTGNLHLV
jgi:hypothetical protein